MLVPVLVGAAAAAPGFQPGLRIVTRETLPTFIIDGTEYVRPDRSRTDARMAAARSGTNDQPGREEGWQHRTTRITRCDLQQFVQLNYDDRTYLTLPLRMYPTAAWRLLASLSAKKTRQVPTSTLVIETTTVQTGERKTAFGYSARHVITTEKRRSHGAGIEGDSESQTDGWYIDLETRPSCERPDPSAVETVLVSALVTSPAYSTGGPAAPAVAVVHKEFGARERGYPIELTTTLRHRSAAGEPSTAQAFVTRKVVTQLSAELVDPGLFEIPNGFRPAEGRLAALAAPWRHAWETVKELTVALFQ